MLKLEQTSTKVRIAVVTLLVVVLSAASCLSSGQAERGVTFENATDLTITVRIDNFDLPTMDPGDSYTTQRREGSLPDKVTAFDQFGTPVFEMIYTWEELERAEWRVIITAEDNSIDPPPTHSAEPTGTPVPQ